MRCADRDSSSKSSERGELEPVPKADPIDRQCRELIKKLTTARRHRSYSITRAAEVAGISREHLHRIETGRSSNLGIGTLMRLAKLYGVTLADLAD